MTIRTLFAAAAAFAVSVSAPALAELPTGARAPDFAAQGALAGKPFSFKLHQALKKGPVVLYFYPKAFTQGCTLEAHAFAEATTQFKAAGATVIGMSNDDVATLQKFSTEACRDKFAVASASPALIKAYDVDLRKPDGSSTGLTKRTSYVIARNGKIVMVHSDMDYRDHVKMTLAAVRKLKG
ncbi:peroxiredoxin [Novosphingobium subterraneum]|uniref:thioredoxin-dependent peroxiredoxin n=1 Tax=Novosphingobium subterraneum TaxID=48936 RepID=A0A0B9AEU2_9SPHN|nr:peroxiredoxin [Novosphingobium subterraneum]KHS49197.1 alkyl hydroperoxide reductase/ Thiol specific antioxidant/ Mal allergen [Novosphingobium subterraneum]